MGILILYICAYMYLYICIHVFIHICTLVSLQLTVRSYLSVSDTLLTETERTIR